VLTESGLVIYQTLSGIKNGAELTHSKCTFEETGLVGFLDSQPSQKNKSLVRGKSSCRIAHPS
jgi:hypothetical protein